MAGKDHRRTTAIGHPDIFKADVSFVEKIESTGLVLVPWSFATVTGANEQLKLLQVGYKEVTID